MQNDRQSGRNGPDPVAEMRVLQTRVDMLYSTVEEIKDIFKGVAETVGMFKVFDHQIKQQGVDLEKLERIVHEQRSIYGSLEKKLTDAIDDLGSDLERNIEDVSSLAKDTKSTVDTQVAYLKGAIGAVTLLGALIYGWITWQGGKYIETVDESERFMHTLQTLKVEEHLRDAMTEPPKTTRSRTVPPAANDADDEPSL
jgi:hypothetical protein